MSGLTGTCLVIFEFPGNQMAQKINNTVLPYNFSQIFGKIWKKIILIKKKVLGLPYLKIGAVELSKMYLKLKDFSIVITWYGQNLLKPKWPQKTTVNKLKGFKFYYVNDERDSL